MNAAPLPSLTDTMIVEEVATAKSFSWKPNPPANHPPIQSHITLDTYHHSPTRTLANIRRQRVPLGTLEFPPNTTVLLLFFDLETTGLSPQTDEIIQFAVQGELASTGGKSQLVLQQNHPPATESSNDTHTRTTSTTLFTQVSHVRTERCSVSPFIQSLTGITQKDVLQAPTFETFAIELSATINRVCEEHEVFHCCWVAHNGHGFDQLFLARYLHELATKGGVREACARSLRSSSTGRRYWCADTLHLARAYPYAEAGMTKPPNYKLETLYRHIVGSNEDRMYHQADADTEAMVKLLRTMSDNHPSVGQLLCKQITYDTYFTDAVQPQRLAGKVRFDDLRGIHGATIQWTPQQEVILGAPFDQHMCIIAGAGCAKTTTLLGRILVLLRNGVPPHRIMLTTFSRDATDEMLSRLALWVGTEVQLVAGTIDGLSRKFLRDNDPDAFHKCQDVSEYKHEFLRFLRRSKRPQRLHVLDSIDYLLVDEYQDINETYYGIIELFAAHGTRVTAVGDDAQNIYSWNGADMQYILQFGFENTETVYMENGTQHGTVQPLPAKTYYLTTNFRSTPEIIQLANQSIVRNVEQLPKTIVPANPSVQQLPEVYFHHTWAQEAHTLFSIVKNSLSRNESVAILSRSCTDNGPLYFYESECARHNLPHALLERHRDHRNHVDYNRVTLSTIHKAKGLEWDTVVVVGCTDQHFPSVGKHPEARGHQDTTQPERSLQTEHSALAEERRLFYVATTRAKKRLVFAYTGSSICSIHTDIPLSLSGSPPTNTVHMTRFLSEVPRSLFTWHGNIESLHYHQHTDHTSPHMDVATITNTATTTTTATNLSTCHSPVDLDKVLDTQSVEEWKGLRNLQAHYMPQSVQVTRHRIHDDLELPSWIKENHMYADIERFCVHIIARMHGTCTHALMERVLKRVAVTRREFAVYNHYEGRHRSNNQETCPHDSGIDITGISVGDLRVYDALQRKLKKRSVQLGVPVSELHVSTRTNIPNDVRERLQNAYNTFMDPSVEWKELLWTLFEVSWVEPIERGRFRYLHQRLEEGKQWMDTLAKLVGEMENAFDIVSEGSTACKNTDNNIARKTHEHGWHVLTDPLKHSEHNPNPGYQRSLEKSLYHEAERDGFHTELPLVIRNGTVVRVCLNERPHQTANEIAREVIRGMLLRSKNSNWSLCCVCTYYPRNGIIERVVLPQHGEQEQFWKAWLNGECAPSAAACETTTESPVCGNINEKDATVNKLMMVLDI